MDSIKKERVPTRGSTEYARLKQTASEQKSKLETKKMCCETGEHRGFESPLPAFEPPAHLVRDSRNDELSH